MSVERVAADLRQVLAALDLAPLAQALALIDHAERAFADATQGSQRPEVGHALAQLSSIKHQLGQLHQALTTARTLVEQYLTNLVGGGAATPPPTARDRPATTGPRFTRDQANAVRASLPPQVPKPNPEGRKTHGKWFDGSGIENHIVSGRDDDSAEAWRLLQAGGMPTASEPASVTHVEMKAATRAVRAAVKHTEVVINNIPCGPRRFSCDALLPILLPEGYSLTVHGPNYRKTYTGGKKWSS